MKKLLIILVLLIAFPAWSATYYIKTGGNDASAGTSDETAWATTARVMATTGYSNIVTSGDTVYFRSQDTWSSSGTPLVLNATAGVTYDGSTYGSGTRAKFVGTAGANSGVYEVVRIFVSNVIFKGFEIDGGAKYDTIGINVGHRVSADIANVTIQNCVVHNVGDNNSNGWPYGIIISSGDGHTTSNVTVIDNEVYDTARGGLNLYASWTTANNKVTGVTVRNNYVHGAGRYFNASGMDICNDIENSTIEYNVLSDSGSGIAIRVSPSGEGPGNVTTAPTNVTIRYNLIRHNKIYGIFYNVDDRGLPFLVHIYGNLFVDNGYNANSPADAAELKLDLGDADSVFNVYNNTFYTATNPNRNQSGMILLGLGDLSDTGATINFKNNIVYADISSSDATFRTIWDRWGALSGTHSNNLIYRSSGASDLLVFDKNTSSYNRSTLTNWEATAKNTNPAFTGGTLPTGFSGIYGTNMVPNTDYFQLTVDSPAKDAGATLASYTGAINGAGLTTPIVRPLGAAYDIGAYEYGTVAQSGGSAGSGFKMQGASINSHGTASCSASTDYIGNKGEGTVGSYSFAYQYIDCLAYTPTCSGNVNTAYVYHRGTNADKIKVALYSKTSTAPAAADELLVQSSAELTSSTDKEWASGAMGSYTVSSSTTYWMCVLVTSNIGAGWPTYYANGDSNRYEKNISSSTLPANLAADYTGPTDDRIPSVYISIGE